MTAEDDRLLPPGALSMDPQALFLAVVRRKSLGLGISPTEADRRLALEIAAGVLQARQPCFQTSCTVRLGNEFVKAHAVWRWPGVVRVTKRETGELIAESEAGQPFELRASLCEATSADPTPLPPERPRRATLNVVC